jgi:hemoglobin
MKKDIQSRKDIIELVDRFYEVVRKDEILGIIFDDVAKVNWQKHLPVMYDFWENTLFYTGTYTGNPIQNHRQLNTKYPLTKAHFDQWISLFNTIVNELFEGEKADLAKQRALNIATVLQIKVAQVI